MAKRKAGEVIDGAEVLSRLWEIYAANSDGELARAMDVGRSTVGAWRRRNSVPFEVAVDVADAKGLSLMWLLSGDGPRDEPVARNRETQQLLARDLLGDDTATAKRFPGADPAAIRRGRAELARLSEESGELREESAGPFVVVPNDPKRTKPIAAPPFEAVMARLQEELALKDWKGLAEALGLSQTEYKTIRKSGHVPYELVMPVAYTHDINPQWLFYGEGQPRLSPDHASMMAAPGATSAGEIKLDVMQHCIKVVSAAVFARDGVKIEPTQFARACLMMYELVQAGVQPAPTSVRRIIETVA